MNQIESGGHDGLRRAAFAATRNWSPEKTTMAFRALGLSEGKRPSLDVIAAEAGVSRETVRRARNELLASLRAQPDNLGAGPDGLLHTLGHPATNETPATARALRRLLTMTGPLAWDEVLTAWARAGDKPPYAPLPTDVASMRHWTEAAGGFIVSPRDFVEGPVTIGVFKDEALDQVSRFLLNSLKNRLGGVDRLELLSAAERAGLKATTIATALSQHPAVIRLGRGTWALRGNDEAVSSSSNTLVKPRLVARPRPTTFGWGKDGSLEIEFSTPRNPSPVVAVPKAVSELIEGREFTVGGSAKPVRISVRNARLWGFGPLVSELGLTGGQRARITLNLMTSAATFTSASKSNGTP